MEFAVEVKNRFNGLQLTGREPEQLWNDIRDIVKETADIRVSKAKRNNVTKWLSDVAVKIADERRDVRSKGYDSTIQYNIPLFRPNIMQCRGSRGMSA